MTAPPFGSPCPVEKCNSKLTRLTMIDRKIKIQRVIHFCVKHGKQYDEGASPIDEPLTVTASESNNA